MAAVIGADMCRSTARMLLRRVRRDRARVAAEYDGGYWQRVLTERAWERTADLRAWLRGPDRRPRVARLAGQIVECPTDQYYDLRIDGLQALVAREAGTADRLVELGCGYGYNLFSLALDTRWQRLDGLDISENGLRAGADIARHFGVDDRVGFGAIDLTRPDHPGFATIAGRTVLTFFCIEQVPHDVGSVVRAILRARPARVIHVEPTTERLQPWHPRDLSNLLYVKSVDYQTRLFGVIGELARAGEVRILSDGRADFSPTLHNDGFVLAWEPA